VQAPEIWIQHFKPFPDAQDGEGRMKMSKEVKSKGERRKNWEDEKRFARLDEGRRKGL
jgi:hypothetical protein